MMKIRGHEFEREKGGYMGGLGVAKGMKKYRNYIIIKRNNDKKQMGISVVN